MLTDKEGVIWFNHQLKQGQYAETIGHDDLCFRANIPTAEKNLRWPNFNKKACVKQWYGLQAIAKIAKISTIG